MADTDASPVSTQQVSGFYRYHYDKMVVALIVLICVVLVLASIVMYQVFHRPTPLFSAQDPDGQVMPLVASDSPNLLPDTLLRWASKAAVAAYTFDFVNYNKQVNALRPYFTSSGWSDYVSSISGLINTIKKNQIFVSGVVSGTPVISNQGDLPGRGYVWRIQIPFLVTYQSSEQTTKKQFTMIVTIIRVPARVNPAAIGIDSMSMV